MVHNKTTILLRVLTVVVLTILYTHGALRNAHLVNTDRHSHDQSAYMNYARNLAESDYTYVGGRNRMPAYPLLLSLVYSPGLSDEAFFERGKYLNIALSLILLTAIFFIVRTYLPPPGAVLLLLISAFTVFIFRAPYVQTELPFYFFNFCLFLLLNKMLRSPTWKWGVATGIVAGVTHLTKASVLPALILFFIVAALKAGSMLARHHITLRQFVYTSLSIASVALLFLVTVFPYISTSKRVFGHYFYNVNTTFYMWYDSWEEVVQGTRAHGDRIGWPDMPPEEIPGPVKYLREHTVQDILVRFLRGFYRLVTIQSYGYLLYLLIYLITACWMLYFHRTHARHIISQDPFLWLFNILYFLAYLTLYAWYAQIAVGPRFTLAQFLPILFALSYLIYRLHPDTLVVPSRVTRKTINVKGAVFTRNFTALVGAILGVDIFFVLVHRIATMCGGG